MKVHAKSKAPQKEAPNHEYQPLSIPLSNGEAVAPPLKRKRNEEAISVKQIPDQKIYATGKGRKGNSKEKRSSPNALALSEPKPLPSFEGFSILEEEGSGGYGTVYKVWRKNDGATFAIKCPHANANRHCVHNELKMLDRFGGKNFVIKYEGFFKRGKSECLILEHFEHDRPEVLKKEIEVFQLQWYGFCLFKAIAHLHKQGVVHRDVKPGNFLFSLKANRGYLIDFNLAMDIDQKYGPTDKSRVGYDVSANPIPLAHAKFLPTINQKVGKSLVAIQKGAGKGSKPLLLPKNLKRKAVKQTIAFTELDSRRESQGADGSGMTSAKDATSCITPSRDRMREPVPCQGRKELINLVHEAMQSSNYEAQIDLALKRKRIFALPGKVDRKQVYLTPMPLHSAGSTVAGSGPLENKRDTKEKREGSCVGTKGFRAPEVLCRSQHQGTKVDIWSAGVTLLYLMIGRAPFTGEPEQNIKEIARLRGSEDLWEVAKLHNSESSFPVDLLDVKFLPSMKLRDWCKQNTKRPEFLDLIPKSLFDLIDKCLIVNPRQRISAEEALRNGFFSPCQEGLRKERLLRR